jgi:hypothetical protein
MIVIDEYLAVQVAGGDWPAELVDDDLGLPATRHWRILQALHGRRGGRLSAVLGQLSPAGLDIVRHPHPEILQILDPRPLLDQAAILAARYGGTGLLTAETLAAGMAHGGLHFGLPADVGRLVTRRGRTRHRHPPPPALNPLPTSAVKPAFATSMFCRWGEEASSVSDIDHTIELRF